MKLVEVVREAWRSTATGASNALTWFGILGLMLIVGALFDLSAVSTTLANQRQFRAAGGDILIVASDGGIDAERCLSLADSNGIDGAMTLRRTVSTLPLAVLPLTAPPVYEYAGKASTVFTAMGSMMPDGLLLSDELAASIGATPMSQVVLTDDVRATVNGVFSWPRDGRREALSGAVLESVPPAGAFDECWVRAWPPDKSLEPLMLFPVEDEGGKQPDVGPLNPRLGQGVPTSVLLEQRITQFLRWVSIGGAVALGAVSVRTRRVELASNLHAGARQSDIALVSFLEGAMWSIPAAVLAVGACVVSASRLAPPEDATSLIVEQTLIIGAAACAAPVGAVLGTLTIRGASLYRYAKDR